VSPRARSRARGTLVQAAAWEFTTVAALDCVLGTATATVAGGRTGHPAALRDPERPNGARSRQATPDEAKGARCGPALLDVSADRASLDASDDLYFVFLMPSWGSRRGISR
jgi:hypothetical protein